MLPDASDTKLAQLSPPIGQLETAPHVAAFHSGGDQVSVRGKSVGPYPAANARQNPSSAGIVNGHNRRPIEGNLVGEFDESILHGFKRAVVVEMLAVDRGHQRHDRRQLKERPIAFVGFDQQEVAVAEAGV